MNEIEVWIEINRNKTKINKWIFDGRPQTEERISWHKKEIYTFNTHRDHNNTLRKYNEKQNRIHLVLLHLLLLYFLWHFFFFFIFFPFVLRSEHWEFRFGMQWTYWYSTLSNHVSNLCVLSRWYSVILCFSVSLKLKSVNMYVRNKKRTTRWWSPKPIHTHTHSVYCALCSEI